MDISSSSCLFVVFKCLGIVGRRLKHLHGATFLDYQTLQRGFGHASISKGKAWDENRLIAVAIAAICEFLCSGK